MGEQIKDDKIVVRVNSEFKKHYKDLCESHGYAFSKRILMLIKNDIKKLENE